VTRRGAHQEAIDVAGVLDSRWPLIYVQCLPASLSLRADAADALGNSMLASQFRSRLTARRGPE